MNKRYLIWDTPFSAIIFLVAAILVVGSINVLSASAANALINYESGMRFFFRYLGYALSGIFLAGLVCYIGYKRLLQPLVTWLFYAVVLGMLVYVQLFGESVNGAARWIYIGSLSLQPSEFAKLAIIMLCATNLAYYINRGKAPSLIKGVGLQLLVVTTIYGVFVMRQPDMGTASIIMALMLFCFIIAGMRWRHVIYTGITAIVGVIIMIAVAPYRLNRIMIWLDPWKDAERTGYQMVQSQVAVGSGGLLGTTWGQGTGKLFYLPEAHTDFAFAIFCQENGFIGAIGLIILFTLLLGAMLCITIKAKDPRGYIVSAGVTLLIVGQAAANMAMVCGLLPVIGIPLVFISYGGSSMWTSMLALGLILSVYLEETKEQQLEENSTAEDRRQNLHFTSHSEGRWEHE